MVQTLWAARGRDELMDVVAEVEALKATQRCGARRGARVGGYRRGEGHRLGWLAAASSEAAYVPVAGSLRNGWLSAAKAQVIYRAVEALPLDPELRGQRGERLRLRLVNLAATPHPVARPCGQRTVPHRLERLVRLVRRHRGAVHASEAEVHTEAPQNAQARGKPMDSRWRSIASWPMPPGALRSASGRSDRSAIDCSSVSAMAAKCRSSPAVSVGSARISRLSFR